MPQRLRCDVAGVIDHGERVYSVLLKPEKPAPRFAPGQFLHLALDPYRPGDFWPDSRVFSIASPPSERESLRITYAVKGIFSTRMEAELAPGRQVWVKLPYGEFCVEGETDVCLLAGGTGMTAFTAFLAGLSAEHAPRVDLFYGARHPGLLIYRLLVEEAVARCPSLSAHYLAEQNADGAGCLGGRLGWGTIGALVRAPQDMTYYLSGPPPMLSALRGELQGQGVKPERIRVDAWE